MDACADCGRPVDDRTYCDACGDRASDPTGSADGGSRAVRGAASPAARAVAVLLAAGALLGGFGTVQSLRYVPQALSAGLSLDTLGFLATRALRVTLLVVFGVMAVRLYDGTANVARYGRALRALATATVAFGIAVVVFPAAFGRWLPTLLDPASVALYSLAFFAAPRFLFGELSVFAVALVGAVVSYLAGVRLEDAGAERSQRTG
jgi:hypothetical protein